MANKTWWNHTAEEYPATGKDEGLAHAVTLVNLETTLSERSKPVTKDDIVYGFIYRKSPEEAKL